MAGVGYGIAIPIFLCRQIATAVTAFEKSFLQHRSERIAELRGKDDDRSRAKLAVQEKVLFDIVFAVWGRKGVRVLL